MSDLSQLAGLAGRFSDPAISGLYLLAVYDALAHTLVDWHYAN